MLTYDLLLLNLPCKEELDIEEILYRQSTVSAYYFIDEQVRNIA